MKKSVIDISRVIADDSVVWPGSEPLRHSPLCDIGPGCPCRVTRLGEWSTHLLTHVDAPAHFIKDGATLDQMPLSRFIAEALVVEIPNDASAITTSHVAGLADVSGKAILFKTRNSSIPTDAPFQENFVYLSPDAAVRLVDKGVGLVGIDYLSVDPASSTDYPVHYTLLGNNVIILEGLQLSGVGAGHYELSALPLKIRDADGSPVRAVLTAHG